MFGKLFRKKPYNPIQVSPTSFALHGEPGGDGVVMLKQELSAILAREGNTTRAYLSKIKYRGEGKVRVALIIDGKKSSTKVAEVIARDCRGLAAIDILVFASLTGEHISELTRIVAPFYEVGS